jgi:hypothetical protein
MSAEETMSDQGVSPLHPEGPTSAPEQSGGYERVRDSWVDGPPAEGAVDLEASGEVDAADPEPSWPPALPLSIREVPKGRSDADFAFVDRMLERLASGDYAGALLAAEALLRRLPRDADALDCAEMSRTELQKLYCARLGSLDRVPSIAMTPIAIAGLTLDVFTGFLLSRIDGLAPLREISLTPGMTPDHALRVLSELYLQGVIDLAS